MKTLQIRVPHAVRAAAEVAARASKCTLSNWTIEALDVAAGLRSREPTHRPADDFERQPHDRGPREASIHVAPPAESRARYELAARAAVLPLRTWAAIVIAQAAGVSYLGAQLRRLHPRDYIDASPGEIARMHEIVANPPAPSHRLRKAMKRGRP